MKIDDMLRFLLMLILAFSAQAGNAGIVKSDGLFFCGSMGDWEDASLRLSNDLIVNNFVFNQRNSFMARGLGVTELSYSATNRGNNPAPFNSQVVGLSSNGDLIFAFEVNPVLDLLSNRTTEALSGDTYTAPGALSQVETFCIAFVHE